MWGCRCSPSHSHVHVCWRGISSSLVRPEACVSTMAWQNEPTEHYGEMLARYLGPAVLRAFADDDVTEIYLNPQDGLVRLDTRSRGKVESSARLDAVRVEMFLNAVASGLGATI